MKYIFALLLCASFALCALAQDRAPSPRRAFQPAPFLFTYTGTDDAAGLAQTPQGFGLPLHVAPLPAGSLVSIYGRSLVNSCGVVLLWHSGGVVAVPATTARSSFPGLETITFRVPEFVTGEVWATVTGRQSSNSVRLFVEE
jgi:hypothetical protein